MSTLKLCELAPQIRLNNLDGEEVTPLENAKGPVLLHFFTLDCPWCQVEIPRLAEVYKRLGEIDTQIVAVALEDDAAEVKKFCDEKFWTHPVLLAGQKSIRDFGLERVPTLVLVDRDGKVARIYEGSSEQLSGVVEQTVLAAAAGRELPDFSLVGNGCAPV